MNKIRKANNWVLRTCLVFGVAFVSACSTAPQLQTANMPCNNNSIEICTVTGSESTCACRKQKYFNPNLVFGPSSPFRD